MLQGQHGMRLSDEEKAMLAGEEGAAREWAIKHQIAVGRFFDAPDFVRVGQAHVMADTESLGETGVAWLEGLAALRWDQRRVRIPTITDPRGIDFASYKRLKQTDAMAAIEARAIAAFEALGVLMTNTCINYQTILPPVRGEHAAFGDTGVVIYANSVMGARSNFEGGPSALSAGLTGRTPRYGYHLDAHRKGTHHFVLHEQPRDLVDWGALGGIVGRATNSYWHVPVISGVTSAPNSDELKHFGAALASFGSVALFQMVGVTPEAPALEAAFHGCPIPKAIAISADDFSAFHAGFAAPGEKVDVVVFAAPQLSLLELQHLAGLIAGRCIHPATSLVIATSPEIKFAADRMGLTRNIEEAGGIVAAGVCFYQMYAREMAEANGWQRLLTNSAKLVNIIAGYGYQPTLASMERCIDSAVAGKIL
jgi:predicted aconitase